MTCKKTAMKPKPKPKAKAKKKSGGYRKAAY